MNVIFLSLRRQWPLIAFAAALLAAGGAIAAAEPLPPPITANVTVDWSATQVRTTAWNFGSNDWGVTDPKQGADDPVFQARLAELCVSLLRLHNGGLSDAWTDSKTKTWNAATIRTAYLAPYLRGKTIIQNIPRWPSWMKQTDGMLDPSEYDAYARFCADLVTVVNGRLHEHVRYWEPLNEQDLAYASHGKLDELWTIYDKCAAAMKTADPSIRVGGAAFTWADPAKVESFLKHSAPNIDFLTWHQYASGSKDDSTEKIMQGTADYGNTVTAFRALADEYSPHRRILLALDEFSVDYSYTSEETRQNTNVGAVWFASVLKHTSESGLDMAASWNLKDGFYGLMDGSDALKPAAQVFAWGNQDLVGAVAKTTSDQPVIEAMAVRRRDGSRSLLLINKSERAATVSLTGFEKETRAQAQCLDASGLGAESPVSSFSQITLPAYSLVMVRLDGNAPRAPR